MNGKSKFVNNMEGISPFEKTQEKHYAGEDRKPTNTSNQTSQTQWLPSYSITDVTVTAALFPSQATIQAQQVALFRGRHL